MAFPSYENSRKIIGHKMGTGGSSGVSYLKRVLDQQFFPELLECSYEIIKINLSVHYS